MAASVTKIECPSCGASVGLDTEFCPYCNTRLIITCASDMNNMSNAMLDKTIKTFIDNNVDKSDEKVAITMGLCYLRLGNYDNATKLFCDLISSFVSNPDVYYYAAISLLKGSKAFLCSRANIDKCVEYLNSALSYEQKPQYYYLMAYIKYDYFSRKAYRQELDYKYYLSKSKEVGLNDTMIVELFNLLKISKPDIL